MAPLAYAQHQQVKKVSCALSRLQTGLSRAETVTVAASHMSPNSRLQSQRRTPLQRPRHLESAPKPQVVDNSARDPGKEHAPQVRMTERPPRDPEKRHATRAHA